MAQVKVFDWYTRESAVGIPGALVNNGVHQADSYAAGVAMNPGDIAYRSAEGIITNVPGEASDIVGIVGHVHKEATEGDYYAAGDAVPVISFGDIYVQAPAAVAVGAELVSGVNMKYMAGGLQGDIVPVRVRL